MQEKNIDTFVINKVKSQDIYNAMVAAGKINEDELYLVEGGTDAITGIKGNNETEYRTGYVNLTAENIGALPADTAIPSNTSDLINDSGFITTDQIPVDDALNSNSTNPVQNKIINAKITSMETDINNKVDKVTGKDLSTNDLTDTLKTNYDTAYTHSQSNHAPVDAEKNTIVAVKKNGTEIAPDTSRVVDITVPTKTSELTNDSGFIVNSDGTAGQVLTKTADGQTWADLGSLAFKSSVSKSDLASDVQTSLGKADSALQSAPVTSVNGETGDVTIAKGDVGLGNVDNVQQYSASNPPPYPVTSVNGKTGDVEVDASAFMVTVTWDSTQSKYVADKTFAEIKTAVANGLVCMAVYGNTAYICIDKVAFNMVHFSLTTVGSDVRAGGIVVSSDNSITVNTYTMPYMLGAGTSEKLIKFSGTAGKLVPATPGTDYIGTTNITEQTLVATETTPTENYAINWVYG